MSANRGPALDRVHPAMWETFRRCRFVRKTFHPYPCLYTGGTAEDGGSSWMPYRGQPYDPEEQELIPDGWDHEHCEVCNHTVNDGDDYWTNDATEHVDLCRTCYPLVRQALDAERQSDQPQPGDAG